MPYRQLALYIDSRAETDFGGGHRRLASRDLDGLNARAFRDFLRSRFIEYIVDIHYIQPCKEYRAKSRPGNRGYVVGVYTWRRGNGLVEKSLLAENRVTHWVLYIDFLGTSLFAGISIVLV